MEVNKVRRLPEVDNNKGFGVVDQALETVSYRQNTTTEGRCVCVCVTMCVAVCPSNS